MCISLISLSAAARNRHIDVVNYLLMKGANPNEDSKVYKSMKTINDQTEEILKAFGLCTPLKFAAGNNDKELAILFIQLGANPNLSLQS